MTRSTEPTPALAAAAALAAVMLLALLPGCCTQPTDKELEANKPEFEPPTAGEVTHASPASTWTYLVEAVSPGFIPPAERPSDAPEFVPGRLPRLWYLLASDVRDRASYPKLVAVWPELRPALLELFNAGFAVAEAPAEEPARTVEELMERRGEVRTLTLTNDAAVREGADPRTITLMFVLEWDPSRFPNEAFPIWRLRADGIEDALRPLLGGDDAPADGTTEGGVS